MSPTAGRIHIEGVPQFGNTDHIGVVKAAAKLEELQAIGSLYRVDVEYQGRSRVWVWAKDEVAARRCAEENIEFHDCDYLKKDSNLKAATPEEVAAHGEDAMQDELLDRPERPDDRC